MKKLLLLIAIITTVSCVPEYVEPSEEQKGTIEKPYDTTTYTLDHIDCKP